MTFFSAHTLPGNSSLPLDWSIIPLFSITMLFSPPKSYGHLTPSQYKSKPVISAAVNCQPLPRRLCFPKEAAIVTPVLYDPLHWDLASPPSSGTPVLSLESGRTLVTLLLQQKMAEGALCAFGGCVREHVSSTRSHQKTPSTEALSGSPAATPHGEAWHVLHSPGRVEPGL